MADADVADGVRILRDGGLHGAVRVHDVRGGRDLAALDGLVGEYLARAAAVLTDVEVYLRVRATDFLPVRNLARVDVRDLREGQLGHRVRRMHDHRDAVDGEREGLKAVLLDLFGLQRTAGVAYLDEPFADLLHADARAAARDGDADVGICGHYALRRLLHNGDMRGASRDVHFALLPLENVERSRDGGRGGEDARQRRESKLLHSHDNSTPLIYIVYFPHGCKAALRQT